jgi:hypothetical protein
VEAFELAEMFHPGLFVGRGPQFFLDRLGDELAQRDAAFSGERLGAAEQKIRDFEGGFQRPILPYLWVYTLRRQKSPS